MSEEKLTGEVKRCAGCGKEKPISEMHEGKITEIRQGRVVETKHWFCNGTSCQGYCQMAHEG